MDFSEKWGKDVEDAVRLALQDLKVERDQVEVIVLEEPSRIFRTWIEACKSKSSKEKEPEIEKKEEEKKREKQKNLRQGEERKTVKSSSRNKSRSRKKKSRQNHLRDESKNRVSMSATAGSRRKWMMRRRWIF